jgi:hypothetical protein
MCMEDDVRLLFEHKITLHSEKSVGNRFTSLMRMMIHRRAIIYKENCYCVNLYFDDNNFRQTTTVLGLSIGSVTLSRYYFCFIFRSFMIIIECV